MSGDNQMKSTYTMDNHNYPGLYQCADITANSRQKTYFLLQKIYLGSLITGGLLGLLASFFSECALKGIYAVLAIVLSAGFLFYGLVALARMTIYGLIAAPLQSQ